MAKPKAQTLQQRFGFKDEDLKTPMHDEIMMWLDKNAEKIINNLFFEPWAKEELEKKEKQYLEVIPKVINDRQKVLEKIRELSEWTKDSFSETEKNKGLIAFEEAKISKLEIWKGFSDYPEKPPLKVLRKQWEYPVSNKVEGYKYSNKYLIGYIDMRIDYEDYDIGADAFFKTEGQYDHKLWDFVGDVAWKITKKERFIFIEVKSEIKSLGELIRQLGTYREYKRGDYYVVCADDHHKDILHEQGIGFIKYAP